MADSETISVLVVEDQHITRLGLVMTLAAFEKLRVVGEASDGRSAIEKSIALQPEVILMDIGMPIMDGIDATSEIKRKLPETRIIVLTANDSDNDIFAALAAGAEGYCLKTIDAEQLSIAIMAVHSGASYLDREIAERVFRALGAPQPKTTETISSLSERELEILKLVVDGLGNQEIGEQLSISNETVKTHVRHILEKLAVSDRIKAAVKAVRQGLV